MELLHVSHLVAVFLVLELCSGLEFTKVISKDARADICGKLRCKGSNLPRGTRSILGMKIYDVKDGGNFLLTSVSGVFNFSDDLETSPPIKLDIALKHGSDCDRGSFMCQLNYMNGEGETDVEVSLMQPDQGCNDTRKESIKQDKAADDPMKGWTLAFRGTAYINQSVYDAYTTKQASDRAIEPGCKQVNLPLPCKKHYRNNQVLDNWANISEVAFIVYKNNTEVRRIVFDGRGTNNMTWFSQNRIQNATWIDFKEYANYFSIDGMKQDTGTYHFRRRFFINHFNADCARDRGWFVVLDKGTVSNCPWESYPVYPVFKYSSITRTVNWDWVVGFVDVADVIAVFVR